MASTRPLPDPFLLIATENPIEQEGTFALPEAQLDRFLVRTSLGYPSVDEEITILDDADPRPSRSTGCVRSSGSTSFGVREASKTSTSTRW